MVKGCETGDFGDRWLKHSKQWLGARWAGLSPWASRQMRPEEAREPSWGGAQTAL